MKVSASVGEQIDRNQDKQKIRNENRRTRIIYGHSLTEEQSDDRDCCDNRAVERDRRITRKNYHHAPNRAQRARSYFKNGDYRYEQGNHSSQRALREMTLKKLKIAAPVDYFIDTRLKKENREKSRGQYLKNEDCSAAGAKTWHRPSITLADGR